MLSWTWSSSNRTHFFVAIHVVDLFSRSLDAWTVELIFFVGGMIGFRDLLMRFLVSGVGVQ